MSETGSTLGAIVGPARSGSTWAGTLVDSCPDVIYRFEPFRRLSTAQPKFRRWFDELKLERFESKELPDLYSRLRRAHPFTSKPPFFPKKSYRQPAFGRQALWPAARIVPPLSWLYERAYSAPPGPPIVFKEVTFIRPLKNFLERTPMRVAYLVRHPCATVLSEINGQQQGMMPGGRQVHLGEILARYNPGLAQEFEDVVAGTDIVKRVALLWRFEVEACVPLVSGSPNGLLVTYERLATDTASESRRLLSHFGLAYSDQTQRYIDYLHGLSSNAESPARRTGWGKKYFSVYRNPGEQHDAWKKRISTEDRRKIDAVLKSSRIFEQCAALGGWT